MVQKLTSCGGSAFGSLVSTSHMSGIVPEDGSCAALNIDLSTFSLQIA